MQRTGAMRAYYDVSTERISIQEDHSRDTAVVPAVGNVLGERQRPPGTPAGSAEN
jgi:hypothetical protein